MALAADMQELESWIAAPFVLGVSPQQWFLLYGLLLLIAFMWHLILSEFGAVRSEV